MRLIGHGLREKENAHTALRGDLDQVHMLVLSLVVFNIEADRLLDLICTGTLHQVMNKALICLPFEHCDIVDESDDLLELVSSLIYAVLRMLHLC